MDLGTKPTAAKIGIALSDVKLGDFESAKAILQEVVDLGSDAARLSYASVSEPYERFIAASELGTLLANEGAFEQSLRLLESALKENPRDVTARYSKEALAEFYESNLTLDPNHSRLASVCPEIQFVA